jgi:hypothetical protein
MKPIIDNQFEDAEDLDPIDLWITNVMGMSRNYPQHKAQCTPRKGTVIPMGDFPKISPPSSMNDALVVNSKRRKPSMDYSQHKDVSESCEKCVISDDSSVDDLSSQGDPQSGIPFQIPDGVSSKDVLCGRGKGANNFIGNRRFRNIVMGYRKAYAASTRRIDKKSICFKIIQKIQSRGGRFLVKQQSSIDSSSQGSWVILPNEKVLIKVSQALREGDTKWNRPTPCDESHGTTISEPVPGISLLAEISCVESAM